MIKAVAVLTLILVILLTSGCGSGLPPAVGVRGQTLSISAQPRDNDLNSGECATVDVRVENIAQGQSIVSFDLILSAPVGLTLRHESGSRRSVVEYSGQRLARTESIIFRDIQYCVDNNAVSGRYTVTATTNTVSGEVVSLYFSINVGSTEIDHFTRSNYYSSGIGEQISLAIAQREADLGYSQRTNRFNTDTTWGVLITNTSSAASVDVQIVAEVNSLFTLSSDYGTTDTSGQILNSDEFTLRPLERRLLDIAISGASLDVHPGVYQGSIRLVSALEQVTLSLPIQVRIIPDSPSPDARATSSPRALVLSSWVSSRSLNLGSADRRTLYIQLLNEDDVTYGCDLQVRALNGIDFVSSVDWDVVEGRTIASTQQFDLPSNEARAYALVYRLRDNAREGDFLILIDADCDGTTVSASQPIRISPRATATPLPSSTPRPTATRRPTSTPVTCVVTVTAETANIRRDPNTRRRPIATASRGTQLTLVAATNGVDGLWYRLSNGGWIRYDLINEENIPQCQQLPFQ